MKKGPFARRLAGTTALVLVTGLLAGLGAGPAATPSQAAVPAAVIERTGGFGDLVEQVMPAVVSISAEHSAPSGRRAMRLPIPREMLPEGFPDWAIPEGAQPRRSEALGSGFVIDPAGYVVTNNHVIDEADAISVTFQDGTTLPAKLVGTDPKTDVALLKVEAERPLPHVEFADSDAVRVGDAVLAVGNPFGLGGTATAGIVSARARDIGAGPYDDFLQIDAAINRGNSGGPAFDLQGGVIGINTAIFSPSGGSVGIGFAIPANLAKSVVAQLRETGTVERGWIGVQIQPVTPDIAEGLGSPGLKGALIADVVDDGPAAKARLQPGDVITAVSGRPVESVRDVTRGVADARSGSEIPLTVLRDGRTLTVEVTPGRMPGGPELVAAEGQAHGQAGRLGLALAPLDSRTRRQIDLPDGVNGVLVTGTEDRVGDKVRAGDVITAAGGHAVSAPKDVAKAVDEARKASRKSVLLRIHRDGTDRYVALDVARS
ncbi:Do family serine endopeptidase [Arenibaculum pallidiluteum]|uniref:Do family serine endopeptidase n=1 Tax=Arenibaculum pallidiluteum TaxID=2812559 RepID=UPI001A9626C5|nr:Do family serine endopeptidase [Arenibaculum pallidiluteum]